MYEVGGCVFRAGTVDPLKGLWAGIENSLGATIYIGKFQSTEDASLKLFYELLVELGSWV